MLKRARLLLAVTLVLYVAAEIAFNLRLVSTVAAEQVDRDRIESLATLGKLTGAFGLVLAAARAAARRLWPKLGWGVALLFLGAWAGIYAALTHIYDTVLDRVPVEIQYDAFDLILYREAVFSGLIEDTDLRGVDGAIADPQRLALVNLAARLTGDKPEVVAMREWIRRGQDAVRAGLPIDPAMAEMVARARDAGDGTLRSATAAVFLPPMSMTLSLIAIVANLGALVALPFGRLPRPMMRRLVGALPVVAVAMFLLAAESQPFAAGSATYRLHNSLESRLGVLGWIWSRAINGEATVLRLSRAEIDGLLA
ncbi:MAG: hypothetical protein GC202_06530 [Alphaproteobacteria bacterium]|nr:hypothetical protein [Alphaproteobacteria bacterium]